MILKHYWKIANPKELFIKNPLLLLKELVKASLINFPYHNITTFGAFPPWDRVMPLFRQILAANMRGEGGLCSHVNTHMKLQLESLGYHADLLPASFRRMESGVQNHFVVKVKIPGYAVKDTAKTGKNLQPRNDKTYLIDVGCGIPLHEPVDLDNLPYYGRAAGLRYRFERVDEFSVQRVHESGDALVGKKPETFVSPQDYKISLKPQNFADFGPAVDYVFRNPRSAFLHRVLYCWRYLDITRDDFEIVCVRGTDLIFITQENRHVQTFESFEKIKPVLYKYFPQIGKREVDLTCKHFRMSFKEALKIPPSNKNRQN